LRLLVVAGISHFAAMATLRRKWLVQFLLPETFALCRAMNRDERWKHQP